MEEREHRSYALGDFCYFGYMAAIAYRTRNTDASIPGVLEGREHALRLLQNFLMSRANSVDFLESSGWMTHELVLQHIYPDGAGRQWSRHILDDPDRSMQIGIFRKLVKSSFALAKGLLWILASTNLST
eukprot:g8501.t1